MGSKEVIPIKCNICGSEILIPSSLILSGKSLICENCNRIICPKCSIKLKNKTYCINCNIK